MAFLLDHSDSVAAEPPRVAQSLLAARNGDEKRRSVEILFASRPVISKALGSEDAAEQSGDTGPEATNLSSALEFAAAVLPADRPGRIVLASDGIATTDGEPVALAASLAEKGIEIDTVPMHPPPRSDAAVVSVKAPPNLREGEILDLAATVHASAALPDAVLRLYQNNLLAAEIRKSLPAGNSEAVFPRVRAEGRMALYEVEVSAKDDLVPENNRRRVAVAHGGPPKVLMVDRNPTQSEALAAALRAAGFETDSRPPAGFPAALEDLDAFDLVIFSDAPAVDFTEEQMKMLQSWTRDFGGGFLMVGGEDSFGAGGYFRTPVSALLPVRIEREEREETPVVALLIILDRSGSMSAPAGGQTKMALANEGAALALEVLQSKDLFGLFAVDTHVQDVVPLGKIADKQNAARRVAGITAGGGGIYIYSSLAEALPRLRDAEAKIKHIILFSDAADAEEKSSGDTDGDRNGGSAVDLAAAMLASRITLSVVALGNEQDKDTAFLRQLAAQGGGRFYLTGDATTLPRLFTLETMRAAESSLREDAFFAQPKTSSDILKGIAWPDSPLLLGFNLTKIKPGAELLLATEKGDPLLAEWRYGLGRVAAFTSDAKARWASEWLGWPGFGKFWAQLARQLARPNERKDFSVSLREENGRLVVEAEAVTNEGYFRDGLNVTVSMAAQGGEPVTVRASQTAPGLYRAVLPQPDSGSAVIAVSDGAGRPVSVAWTGDYPAEYQATGKDGERLLRQLSALTHGKFAPSATEIFRPARHPALIRRSLSAVFLGLALLLWPVDIWLRRRQWNENKENSLPPFSRAN